LTTRRHGGVAVFSRARLGPGNAPPWPKTIYGVLRKKTSTYHMAGTAACEQRLAILGFAAPDFNMVR
jgi:hypothetical protein